MERCGQCLSLDAPRLAAQCIRGHDFEFCLHKFAEAFINRKRDWKWVVQPPRFHCRCAWDAEERCKAAVEFRHCTLKPSGAENAACPVCLKAMKTAEVAKHLEEDCAFTKDTVQILPLDSPNLPFSEVKDPYDNLHVRMQRSFNAFRPRDY